MVFAWTASQKRSILLAITLVLGVCFLLGSERRRNAKRPAQWDVKPEGAIRSDIKVPTSRVLFHSERPTSSAEQGRPTPPPQLPDPTVVEIISQPRRANATLVILARNSDLEGVVASMEQVETKFNQKFKYPWVLLNDEEFSADFKRRVSVLTDVNVSFGVVPQEHWVQPDWVDENKAREGRDRLMSQGIIYGDSVSYRNMCRFNSGYFFRHELLLPYKWYWRVEPDVRYFCHIDYDPFLFMEDNNKLYGFTMSMPEWEPTISTLWSSTKEFIDENPQYLHGDNSIDFVSDDAGETYNLCHFWSNFEIASMDFWRSEVYMKYFEFLETKGGFYYERWGDAPVHSIAVSLFASREQIHFFKDIGYRHSEFQHCPQGPAWRKGHCSCDPKDNFDFAPNSCLKQFMRLG